MTPSRYSRRTALLGVAIAAVPAAGCLEFDDNASGSAEDREDEPADSDDDQTEDGRDGEGAEDDPGGNESETDTDSEEVEVEEVATGLSHPWAIAILPEGGLLVTERGVGSSASIRTPATSNRSTGCRRFTRRARAACSTSNVTPSSRTSRGCI